MAEQDGRDLTTTQEQGDGYAADRPPASTGSRPRRTGYTQTPLGHLVDSFASRAIGVVVNVLVLFMVVMLVWGVVSLGIVIVDTVQQRDSQQIKDLVIGVLTIFIIIEIFDLFREYLRSAHIRVTNLAEVSLAVVLRELWLLLLDGSENWQLYASLALVVAALAGFWWLAMSRSSTRETAAASPETRSDECRDESPEPTGTR